MKRMLLAALMLLPSIAIVYGFSVELPEPFHWTGVNLALRVSWAAFLGWLLAVVLTTVMINGPAGPLHPLGWVTTSWAFAIGLTGVLGYASWLLCGVLLVITVAISFLALSLWRGSDGPQRVFLVTFAACIWLGIGLTLLAEDRLYLEMFNDYTWWHRSALPPDDFFGLAVELPNFMPTLWMHYLWRIWAFALTIGWVAREYVVWHRLHREDAMRIRMIISLVLALASAPTYSLARGDVAEQDKEIRKILAAKYALEFQDRWGVSKGYADLFRRIGPHGIRELKKHNNHGVALRAAWEEIRLTVPEKPAKRGMPVDADALEGFLGFVKDRLPVPVPRWWQRRMLSAKGHRRDNFYFPGSLPMYEAAGVGLSAKPGVNVEKRGKKLLLTIGQESVLLPESVVENQSARHHFSAGLGPANAYLAVHSICPSGYPLYCVNRNSGKLIWKANVWADGGGMFYSGLHFHNVAVFAHEKHVTVFGGSSSLLYVEAFNAENGAVLYRFSTGY